MKSLERSNFKTKERERRNKISFRDFIKKIEKEKRKPHAKLILKGTKHEMWGFKCTT